MELGVAGYLAKKIINEQNTIFYKNKNMYSYVKINKCMVGRFNSALIKEWKIK